MNTTILRQLNQRPIAYYPVYRQITGSTTAGILLSQLMYWFSVQDKFYKTDKEIMEETLLTERELKTAKTKLKKVNFIKITREGVPAKTYYSIDWNEYEKTLSEFAKQDNTNRPNKLGRNSQTGLNETAKLNSANRPNLTGRNSQTITENTHKNTTENTNKEIKEKKVTKKEKTLINSQTREFLNNLGVDESFANQLIEYRKEIGAPFKSAYGLNSLLSQYLRTKLKLKVSVDKIFEIQSGHEWQSVKKEWIERELENEQKEKMPLKEDKSNFDLNNYLSEAGRVTAQNAMAWLKEEEAREQEEKNTIDTELDENEVDDFFENFDNNNIDYNF